MPTLSTTYLLPAILLNPAFILHIINTFVSHLMPPPHTISHSPHQFMESLGPLPGSKPYLDMHADEQLCWRYTAIMVIVQILAFGRVQDNRGAKKLARAAKLEREKARKEKLEEERKASIAKTNGYATDGTLDSVAKKANGVANGVANGSANGKAKTSQPIDDCSKPETESEDGSSMTETSEEEMII